MYTDVCVCTLTAAPCLLRECQDALTMTVLRTMLVSLLKAGWRLRPGPVWVLWVLPTVQSPQLWM